MFAVYVYIYRCTVHIHAAYEYKKETHVGGFSHDKIR